VEPLTLIEGTEGVTEMDGALIFGPRAGAGASFTEMLGMGGVTPIEGTLLLRLLGAGDSLTDMLGIGGVTPMLGVLRPRLGAGDSLTEMLGTGGLTPIDGTLAL
jgi:hypothetical protein